ncbi:hypothetical protein V6M85_06710 [Sulfolobus tengchongensis]|uniref:Uncharacterized protein n=1 Tax=Sulfolobus tengchongensis TaxID=207809 RepID=A0AAX4KYI1_9CREN
MPYAEEIEVKGSRSQLLAFFMDPIRFTGILGHMMIVNIFDKNENKFVPMGNLKNPENKYKILYALGDPESKIDTFVGTMEGPTLMYNTITYKGDADNSKITWKIDIIITELSRVCRLRVVADIKQKQGLFDRPRMGDIDLATHLVKEHLIPFVKFYFKPSLLEEISALNEVFRFRGSVEETILKLREIIGNIKYGGIIIIGESLNIIASISNGEILHVQINNSDVQSGDIFTHLLKTSGNIELIAYDVSLDELIFKNLRRKLEEIKTRT